MLNYEPGTIIAKRYEVMERLGVGGQGAVFRVRDTGADSKLPHGESLALKIVVWGDHEDSDNLVKRINTEYAVLSKLDHPNIIKVYDFGLISSDSCFIAMEYIDGVPLSERISNVFGPLPFAETLHILREIALGLECAHNASVIHRDLKPANIMLTSYGEVKILDFGLARDMELGMTITKTGETIGTPYYMSPEQFTRMATLDERSDIYAVGMIAYELVTGKPPFKEGAYHEIAMAHLRDEIPPLPADIPEKIPGWFHSFVCVCAEKKQAGRFQSMREVVDFLEDRMVKMKLIRAATNPNPNWIQRLADVTWG